MADFVEQAKQQGVDCFAFGDLFLEDIRRYREARLATTGITPLFPLWGMPTAELSREMVNSGLRAKITCIDPHHLSADFAGQDYDLPFLERLPAQVDPCGENGEFHSFAFDGPMFRKAVSVATGETVSRDGFLFTDLLPGTP
jgi:diphthamide synthase (EF-2-diphthine--ammonia ligase)